MFCWLSKELYFFGGYFHVLVGTMFLVTMYPPLLNSKSHHKLALGSPGEHFG